MPDGAGDFRPRAQQARLRTGGADSHIMADRILIVGAGGFGREVLQWTRDAGLDRGGARIVGFLDDNPDALTGSGPHDVPVLGPVATYRPRPEDRLVCGLGVPSVKQRCLPGLVARGARFLTVVHPSAAVGANVRLRPGCVICPGCVLTTDIELGEFVMLNCCSTIGHDSQVGDYTTLSGHACVNGHCRLGRAVFLGSNAVVLPGVQVSDGATVGAGSVAWKTVPPRTTVFGVPAKPIWVQPDEPSGQL